MPRRNGTDSEGQSPGTGRRGGGCFGSFKNKNKNGKFSVWRALLIPMIGAIINDLRKPDSISRQTVNSIVDHLKSKKITDKINPTHEIKGCYSVVDTENEG